MGGLLVDSAVALAGCLGVVALLLAAAYRRSGRRGRIALVTGLALFALVITLCTQASAIQAALAKLGERPSPSGATLMVISPSGLVSANFIAVSGRDGSTRWTHPNLSVGDAASVDGVIYTLGSATHDAVHPTTPMVAAYRLSDGAQLWRVTEPTNGLVTPLLVAHGLAIFGVLNSHDATESPPPLMLYAIDITSHALAWSVQEADKLAIPITLAADTDKLFVGMGDGVVRALRLSDGGLIWRRQIVQGKGVTEVERGVSQLYASDANGVVEALRPADGSVVWTTQSGLTNQAARHAPILTQTGLYICGSSSGAVNTLMALDPLTGAIHWQRRVGCHQSSMLGADSAPVAADGVIYVPTGAALVALRASDGDILWQRTTQTNDLGFTSVQVDHGVVFAAASLVDYHNLNLCWQAPIPFCHSPSFIAAFDGRTGTPYWQDANSDSPLLLTVSPG